MDIHIHHWPSQVAQQLKICLPMQEPQEMQVRSLGWEIPWRRKWQPLQYSCLGNPMDRGAWWNIGHKIAKSRIQLSNWAQVHSPLLIQLFWLKTPLCLTIPPSLLLTYQQFSKFSKFSPLNRFSCLQLLLLWVVFIVVLNVVTQVMDL